MGVTGVGHAFLHSGRVLVSPRSREEATFKNIETQRHYVNKRQNTGNRRRKECFLQIAPIVTTQFVGR
jgi:hypothetical protein